MKNIYHIHNSLETVRRGWLGEGGETAGRGRYEEISFGSGESHKECKECHYWIYNNP